jgi:ligand-binding sensor domain-containing protein
MTYHNRDNKATYISSFWICTENGKNIIPKRGLNMNLETIPRGRSRNRWQDEVRVDGRIVGGEEWQEKVYNRQEWKKLLRTARNRRILHMPME